MTQEATATELQALREQAEVTAQNIDQISSTLSNAQETLQQIVSQYSAKRVKLLKEKLHARGMTWCTYCSKVIPESETELLLIEGRAEYTHGYGDAYYGFRGFSKLHRACHACRERSADKHGWKSPYDSQAEDQASFYAFRVEKRDDGYYARKFGKWVKLDDENCKLDELSSRLVEKLAEEWNLPPRIETKSNMLGTREKLVIHEPATAEAS